jgi:hypothetical protein
MIHIDMNKKVKLKAESQKKRKNHWSELYLPVAIIIVMRVGGFLYMFIDPVIGILLSFLFDCLDAFVLYLFDVPYSGHYHKIDKRLDYLQYVLLLPIAWFYPIFNVILIAYIFRTIGDVLVYFTNRRIFFIIFPNFIEYIFLIYLIIDRFSLPINWYSPYILIPLCIFKLVQELLIHKTSFGQGYWKGILWVPKLRTWVE